MQDTLSRRRHIAVLDEELPFPLNSGKRIRTYHLLSRLARRQRITFLCHAHADPSESSAARAAFAEVGIRCVVVERSVPAKSGPAFYGRLVANLFSGMPYSVATHRSPELAAAVARLCDEDPPDLWHCEWTPYAEYLRRPAHTAPWVVMAHNVEALIWQRYAETESNILKRWYIRQQFRKFENFEHWAYSACTMPIAVSESDAALIRERFGAARCAIVDNGVDTTFFEPPVNPSPDPFTILFLGSLDWRPNLDAVQQLLDTIFPSVRKHEARARLVIVGRKPPAWLVQRCAGQENIKLHADVADVRPFLFSAGVLAVPLRIGGGSRLKIVEALAAGVPVVTTAIGAEGLKLENERHITIIPSVDEMAAALVQALNFYSLTRKQAERGRQRVLAAYDWTGLADRLEAVWLDTLQRKSFSSNHPGACLV